LYQVDKSKVKAANESRTKESLDDTAFPSHSHNACSLIDFHLVAAHLHKSATEANRQREAGASALYVGDLIRDEYDLRADATLLQEVNMSMQKSYSQVSNTSSPTYNETIPLYSESNVSVVSEEVYDQLLTHKVIKKHFDQEQWEVFGISEASSSEDTNLRNIQYPKYCSVKTDRTRGKSDNSLATGGVSEIHSNLRSPQILTRKSSAEISLSSSGEYTGSSISDPIDYHEETEWLRYAVKSRVTPNSYADSDNTESIQSSMDVLSKTASTSPHGSNIDPCKFPSKRNSNSPI